MTEQEKQNQTEREISAWSGVSVRQLRAHRMRGDGPRYLKVSGEIGKRGGRVLYPVREFEAWLRSRPMGGEVA